MKITPIQTRVFLPPKDDLLLLIRESVTAIPENSILAVTSKVVSIWQGRCRKRSSGEDKETLIKRQAEKFIPREKVPREWATLTIKRNIVIPSAGIDESNANDYYILWPKDPPKAAQEIFACLKKEFHLAQAGVIITDSHTTPMRRGVVGISLGHAGFEGLRDYRGERDIFGRKLRITQANVVDALATAAVLLMGEGNEKTPLALIEDLPFVDFSPKRADEKNFASLEIDPQEDLYRPLLENAPWEEGGKED
jgi:putative folate metabolism gamma-glutamate ligase